MSDSVPVVLVHGWAGSFASTWQRSGFSQLLADAGRPVIGVDLLGHGTAPKPHDVAAYADLTGRIAESLPAEAVDAIGFSLGGITLLRLAAAQPARFRRLVIGGVGRNAFDADPEQARRMIEAVEGTAADDDTLARAFANYATEPGNDALALAAVLRAQTSRLSPEQVGTIACPTLVVIGDADFAGPADVLVEAIPGATLKVLRNTDHFATPESFGFIDAALQFIDAVPA